jgi:hypothetical protein
LSIDFAVSGLVILLMKDSQDSPLTADFGLGQEAIEEA